MTIGTVEPVAAEVNDTSLDGTDPENAKGRQIARFQASVATCYARAMHSDLELVENWRDGSDAAGQELVRRYFDDVYRFFRNKCATESDDLVQRTFLEIIKSRDSFRAESSFRTFLFVIARRVLYGYLRKRKRDDALDFGVTSLGEIVTSVGTKMARNQEAERLREALEILPVDDQVLIELRYWHEFDATALGEVFECPPATVRTRLRRARLKLQEKLGNDEATASLFKGLDDSD